MGTSSSYGGPVGLNPLLPPWAGDDIQPLPNGMPEGQPPPQEPVPEPEVSWRSPKTVMSRLARSNDNPTYQQLKSLGHSYVRARGGATTATKASRAGRSTLATVGRFFATGVREGFERAVENLGIAPLVGQDLQTFLYSFVEMVAPAGSMLEEAAARSALLQTLEWVFEQADWNASAFNALENVNEAYIQEIIQTYVRNYINVRIQQELANCVERGTRSEREANQLMGDIAGFVAEVITFDFGRINVLTVDWEGAQGHGIISEIYEMAYKLVGGE